MNLRITDHPGLRKFLTAVLFFAAVILLMFFRNPRIFTDPEPFWEDMSIFLAEEYITGFPDTLLITHSGYLHVIPRIVAWIGLCFGLSHAMAVMNLIVLFFKALTAWLVFSSKEITSSFIRCSLSAYLVLLPFPTEIYNNITNLQWWLIGLMAMLIIRRESSVRGLLFSCVLLLLSGLSGVNSILFYDLLPIYISEGYDYVETNPELESNDKVQQQWIYFERRQHKRRRCYKKEIK